MVHLAEAHLLLAARGGEGLLGLEGAQQPYPGHTDHGIGLAPA
jgi:hypothetical protein